MPDVHFHNAIEIVGVLEGVWYYRFDGNVVKISKNDILLISSNKRHQSYVEMNSNCRGIDLAFDFGQVPDVPKDPLNQEGIENSSVSFQEAIFGKEGYLKLRDDSGIKECMKRIIAELENKETDYELLVKIEIAELFIKLSRIINKSVRQNDCIQNEYVDKAIDFIHNSLSQELTPEIIAKEVHISRGYLKHIFKKCTGHSITEYITRKRMDLTKQFLANTGIKISEISMEVGLTNFQHFSALFKKYTGMSPTQYRKISQLENYERSKYGGIYEIEYQNHIS